VETGVRSAEGFVWDGVCGERAMPRWRQPATTTAAPPWLDAGLGKRACLDLFAVGGETIYGVSGA